MWVSRPWDAKYLYLEENMHEFHFSAIIYGDRLSQVRVWGDPYDDKRECEIYTFGEYFKDINNPTNNELNMFSLVTGLEVRHLKELPRVIKELKGNRK